MRGHQPGEENSFALKQTKMDKLANKLALGDEAAFPSPVLVNSISAVEI